MAQIGCDGGTAHRGLRRSSATPRPPRWSGRDGSIDWLCLPRFDSAACFASLLGDEDNGYWRIAAAGESRRTRPRRYRDDTLVLETEFDDGRAAPCRVIDCMPIREDASRGRPPRRGLRARSTMRMDLAIRFGYGYDRALGAAHRRRLSPRSPGRTGSPVDAGRHCTART